MTDADTVYIDPGMSQEVAECLRLIASLPARTTAAGVDEARALNRQRQRLMNFAGDPSCDVRDIEIPARHGPIRCRLYAPPSTPAAVLPCLVWFHGGGFTSGDLNSSDPQSREIAVRAGIKVISVDYPLAPEVRFPVPAEAAIDVVRWIATEGAALGIDTSRLAIGGDSAGGNLAAVAVNRLAADHGRQFRFQLLIYPVLDQRGETDSYRRHAVTATMTAARMRKLTEGYLRSPEDALDTLASPLLSARDGAGPETLIISAEQDPLFDESRLYAAALRENSVLVEHRAYGEVFHGFWGWGRHLPLVHELIGMVAERLRAALSSEQTTGEPPAHERV